MLTQEIERLKKQHNAVILAHYYQDDDVQDIADFIGDSLDLSRKAQAAQADVILFCGVKFMAEVAKILSPDRIVLVPDMTAGCSLEDSCQPEDFAKFKAKHPDHLCLTYINCSAEIKALSDIIVTSSNAEKIINQIPKDQKIIFAPDRFLGEYLIRKTGRDMVLWHGSCIVHENFSEKEVISMKVKYPKAHVIAHPECPSNLLNHAEFIGSTSQLLKFTADRPNEEFIILTEPGIIHQMKKANPNGKFYDVKGYNRDEIECVSCNSCPFMKKNTIEKIYSALMTLSPRIELDLDLIERAKKPLVKMLEMSK